MFTLQEDDHIIHTNIFPVEVKGSHNLKKVMSFSDDEIYWNIKEYVSKRNLLVICDTISECQNSHATLSLYLESTGNNLRSSSPRSELNDEIISLVSKNSDKRELKNIILKSKTLHISSEIPNDNIIKTLVQCSNNVEINVVSKLPRNSQCNQKYLTEDGLFNEIKCLRIDKVTNYVPIQCKVLNEHYRFLVNKTVLDLQEQTLKSGMKGPNCCINSTHFVSFYGHCNNLILNHDIEAGNNITYVMSKYCNGPYLEHSFFNRPSDFLVFLKLFFTIYDCSSEYFDTFFFKSDKN